MRRFLVVIFSFVMIPLTFSFTGCDKESMNGIEGIVLEEGGCFPNSWVVRVIDPERLEISLLCADSQSTAMYDCSNSFFMTLPPDLAKAGTHIVFTGPRIVPTCFSSTGKPPHVEVSRMWKK